VAIAELQRRVAMLIPADQQYDTYSSTLAAGHRGSWRAFRIRGCYMVQRKEGMQGGEPGRCPLLALGALPGAGLSGRRGGGLLRESSSRNRAPMLGFVGGCRLKALDHVTGGG
jgi:hypothetical protein